MTEDMFHRPHDGPRRDILTVRQLGERIQAALGAAFPQTVWVRGEIQRLPADAARRKHVYFELHESGRSGAAEYQIPVALMDWDRRRYGLGRYLDGTDPDLQLANRIEVCLEAEVDFYPPFGKLSLKVVGVDKTFSLGRLEAQRREVMAFLTERGLMEQQLRLPLPDLPLRVGLITAAGSAAERDFMTGIQTSDRPFQVSLRGAKMQGSQLQAEVIRALGAHVRDRVDVIVITRGGGSRADLSWFDQRDLAVAIAECSVPVITAIGHEIDRSIADLVAHHSCKTPTAAAEYLVDRVEAAAERVAAAAERLVLLCGRILTGAAERMALERDLAWAAERRLQTGRSESRRLAARLQRRVTSGLAAMSVRNERMQNRLAAITGAAVATAWSRCGALAVRLGVAPGRCLRRQERQYRDLAAAFGRTVDGLLGKKSAWLQQAEVQVKLQDPARLLARGYTMTLHGDGRPVRSAAELAAGQRIETRFSDGKVSSIVQTTDVKAAAGRTATGNRAKKGSRRESGKKTDPAQKTLFR